MQLRIREKKAKKMKYPTNAKNAMKI